MTPYSASTCERLASELEAADKEMTPGKWLYIGAEFYPWIQGQFDDLLGMEETIVEWNEGGEQNHADARGIAHLRNSAPGIAAALRAAVAEVVFWKDLYETSLERLTDIKRDRDDAVSRAAASEAENTHSFLRMLKLRDDAAAERDSLRTRLAALSALCDRLDYLAIAALGVQYVGDKDRIREEVAAIREKAKETK